MPCSSCGTWVSQPSWHRCEKKCVSDEGVVKHHTGNEIQCSRSWDDTYWFFFCHRCKTGRPRIRGVLRNVRIWRSPYCKQNGYITESEENSYCSSDEESFTLEEDEEYHSIQESAQVVSLKNRAVECFCIRSFTKRLYVNLFNNTKFSPAVAFQTNPSNWLSNFWTVIERNFSGTARPIWFGTGCAQR